MKVLTCPATRRRLEAFHDGELSIKDQIAVSAHLEWCAECAAELAALRDLEGALRLASPGRAVVLADHEDAAFAATVVARMRAEETLSFETQVREMFEDMHFVYAGLGAAAAAIVCVAIMLGMMRVATAEEPDSLAAMMKLLVPPSGKASAGSNENPVGLYPDVQAPRALDDLFFATSSGSGTDDTVFTLSAVVTREGRVAHLEMLRASRVGPGGRGVRDATDFNDAQRAEDLMGNVSFARFEPANFAGSPVAVNMVFIVAHTTVRGAKTVEQARAVDPPVRRVRGKRTAALAVPAPHKPAIA